MMKLSDDEKAYVVYIYILLEKQYPLEYTTSLANGCIRLLGNVVISIAILSLTGKYCVKECGFKEDFPYNISSILNRIIAINTFRLKAI